MPYDPSGGLTGWDLTGFHEGHDTECWKRLGARSGYSVLNGLFIALICLTGTIQAVLGFIPLESGIGILLYIGVIIVAQSFQETPKEHAPAVALGAPARARSTAG